MIFWGSAGYPHPMCLSVRGLSSYYVHPRIFLGSHIILYTLYPSICVRDVHPSGSTGYSHTEYQRITYLLHIHLSQGVVPGPGSTGYHTEYSQITYSNCTSWDCPGIYRHTVSEYSEYSWTTLLLWLSQDPWTFNVFFLWYIPIKQGALRREIGSLKHKKLNCMCVFFTL